MDDTGVTRFTGYPSRMRVRPGYLAGMPTSARNPEGDAMGVGYYSTQEPCAVFFPSPPHLYCVRGVGVGACWFAPHAGKQGDGA